MDSTAEPGQESTNPTTQPSRLEHIRTIAQNPDAKHRAFDSYPWSKDPQFQSSLATGLLNQNELSPGETALQCRIKRYEDRVGIKIDVEEYRTYRTSGDRPRIDIVPQVILEQEALYEPDVGQRRYAAIANDPLTSPSPSSEVVDENVPSWQRAAPKAALYINKSDVPAKGDSEKEPYPKKFEEIIAFLQTGKEIPGIVKIPDTVVDDPSISTTTGRSAPLKPWEKRNSEDHS